MRRSCTNKWVEDAKLLRYSVANDLDRSVSGKLLDWFNALLGGDAWPSFFHQPVISWPNLLSFLPSFVSLNWVGFGAASES